MSEPQYVAETLAWCNARRAELGKKPLAELPKGMRHEPLSCPCGRATGLKVYEDEFMESDLTARYGLPVPRSVGRFVRAFDAGRLPQYEAKS